MHSSIRKLQKFLQLESERGYDNRAVVGGLDKILPAWLKEALEDRLEQRLIDYVAEKIQDYAEQDTQSRRGTVRDLLSELKEPGIQQQQHHAPKPQPTTGSPENQPAQIVNPPQPEMEEAAPSEAAEPAPAPTPAPEPEPCS